MIIFYLLLLIVNPLILTIYHIEANYIYFTNIPFIAINYQLNQFIGLSVRFIIITPQLFKFYPQLNSLISSFQFLRNESYFHSIFKFIIGLPL